MNLLILMVLIVASSTAWTPCRHNQDCVNKKFCWFGYCWPNNLGDSCSTSAHCSSGLTCSRPTGSKTGLCVIGSALILLPIKIIIKNVTFQIGNLERNSSSNTQTVINVPTIADIRLEDISTHKYEVNIESKTTTEFVLNFTLTITILEKTNMAIPSSSTIATDSLYRETTEFPSFSTVETDTPSRVTTTKDTIENTAEDIAVTKDSMISSTIQDIIEDRCDEPWRFFRGRCYFQMDDGSYTYFEANTNCIDMGAVLVTIANQDVTEFLYSNFYFKHPFWIGLVYSDKGWKWPDGTKLRYQLWGQNEPNTTHQCVFAETKKNGGHWYTGECNDKILHDNIVGYVCQQ